MASSNAKGSPNGAQSWTNRRPKFDAKKDAEKDEKMMPKGSQNDDKINAKMDKKSVGFRNLQLLCFCRVYKLKMVYFHQQGARK